MENIQIILAHQNKQTTTTTTKNTISSTNLCDPGLLSIQRHLHVLSKPDVLHLQQFYIFNNYSTFMPEPFITINTVITK